MLYYTGLNQTNPSNDFLLLKNHMGSSIKYVPKVFRKPTFLTLRYSHICVRIRGLEMLVFRTILRTYLMDSPYERKATFIARLLST